MKKIGITLGDPKGIGPEIVFKALDLIPSDLRSMIKVYPYTVSSKPSELEVANFVKESLELAIADIKKGEIFALVTAPVNKKRVHLVDKNFRGHTEFLASAFGVKDVVMFFVSTLENTPFRVGLVTTHLPLHKVSSKITVKRIVSVASLIDADLKKYFKISKPKIAVLGLNPHAGEGGILGLEELEIIKPAVDVLKEQGISCFGPVPAESVFRCEIKCDAVISMYHDQGLTPLKLLCGEKLVNMTLGLPFIRTSPAHGTAEDIAGRNIANAQSMVDAINIAVQMI